MNQTQVNFKVDVKVKERAQKVATQMGLSLSAVLSGFLRQFIRTKEVYFTLQKEKPRESLLSMLHEAEEDRRRGNVYAFDKHEDALEFVDKLRRRKKV